MIWFAIIVIAAVLGNVYMKKIDHAGAKLYFWYSVFVVVAFGVCTVCFVLMGLGFR